MSLSIVYTGSSRQIKLGLDIESVFIRYIINSLDFTVQFVADNPSVIHTTEHKWVDMFNGRYDYSMMYSLSFPSKALFDQYLAHPLNIVDAIAAQQADPEYEAYRAEHNCVTSMVVTA